MSVYLYSHPRVLSLLEAAKCSPEENCHRLVLADWLEDHGDPDRAEYIRLQCRPGPDDADSRRQQELIRARFPVVIVFAGVDGAGKGETVNLLNTWMDPRWIETRAYGTPSEEEPERPEYGRFVLDQVEEDATHGLRALPAVLAGLPKHRLTGSASCSALS